MRPSARPRPRPLANQLGDWHAHGVQMDIAGMGLPGHGLVAADHFHAGRCEVHEEGADFPLGTTLRGGGGHEHGKVRKRRAGDKALMACQHVMLALQNCSGFESSCIGSSLRFRQGKADGFFGTRHRQDELLHLQRRGLAHQRPYARRAAELAQHMGANGEPLA